MKLNTKFVFILTHVRLYPLLGFLHFKANQTINTMKNE